MKLLRPRFTIRRLMVIVALAAALLAVGRTYWVWRERRLKAAEYLAEAASWAGDASKVERMMVKPSAGADPASRQRLAELREVATNYREHERSYRELAVKYERAAAQPWLPIEPGASRARLNATPLLMMKEFHHGKRTVSLAGICMGVRTEPGDFSALGSCRRAGGGVV
jgi:hypothetical protein